MVKLILELKTTFVIVFLISLAVFGGAAGITMVRGKFILPVAIVLTVVSCILSITAYVHLRKNGIPLIHSPKDK